MILHSNYMQILIYLSILFMKFTSSEFGYNFCSFISYLMVLTQFVIKNDWAILFFMKYQCVKTPFFTTIDLQQCSLHKSATQPGQLISIQHKCKCCHLPYKKRSLNVWFSENSILHMGPGIALFFRYIIICVISVLIPTLAYSIVTTISNINGQLTQNFNISQNWTIQMSNVNSISNYNIIYSYVLLASALALIFVIPFLVRFALGLLDKIYSRQAEYFYPQALAVLFKLERPVNYTQEDVIKTINQWFQFDLKLSAHEVNEGFNVVQQIFFHFNHELFQTIQNQINQYQCQKLKQENYQSIDNNENQGNIKLYQRKDSLRSYSSKNSYKTLNAKLNKIEGLKQKIRNKQLQKTNKFIVIFKRFEYAQKIKQHSNRKCCKKSINSLIFPGENMAEVFQAPFPSQIKYGTQHYDYSQKRKRRIFSWILTVIVIGVCTGLYFGLLSIYKKVTQTSRPDFGSIILGAAFYLLSQLGNKISTLLLKFEDQPNITEQKSSELYHRIITTLFLKGFSIYFVFTLSGIMFYQRSGLVQVITWTLIIWSSMIILKRFINYQVLYSLYRNIRVRDEVKRMKIYQKQANKLFQSPENKLNLQYAELTSLIFISFLFCSLIPIALFLCSGTLLISYLVQRICFVDVYKQPAPASETSFLIISNLLWKSPIFVIVGHLYMIYSFEILKVDFSTQIKVIISILLVLCILALFIPYKFLKKAKNYDLEYKDIKDKLVNCYSEFNPLYCISFPEPPLKSITRTITKNQILISELNTMSKSLELTLRQKLFSHNNPRLLQSLGNHDESMYFQFDNKVIMPQKKGGRSKNYVPPIFKQSRQDKELKRNESRQKNDKLVKLTHLVNEQQVQIKHKIKEAIKGSINKIK